MEAVRRNALDRLTILMRTPDVADQWQHKRLRKMAEQLRDSPMADGDTTKAESTCGGGDCGRARQRRR